MQCPKCGQPVAAGAKKCNGCHEFIYLMCETRRQKPDLDMFGMPTKEIPIDSYKSMARNRYINTLPELRLASNNNRYRDKSNEMFAVIILLVIAVQFAPVLALVIAGDNVILSLLLMILFGGGAIGGIMVWKKDILFGRKKTPVEKNYAQNLYLMEQHRPKRLYYYSNNVLGFSSLVAEQSDSHSQFFTYYEVRKDNIRGIRYDSRFGEYVLLLKYPVYIDYTRPHVMEFILPDIFDDTALSMAMEIDLPPRNVPF